MFSKGLTKGLGVLKPYPFQKQDWPLIGSMEIISKSLEYPV